MKEEEKSDVLAMEATNMALMGMTVDQICVTLDRLEVPYTRGEVEREVAAAKEKNRLDAEREAAQGGPALVYNTEVSAAARRCRDGCWCTQWSRDTSLK
eukprot:scaffold629039_cov20-Prasinocladus_malaysianus.AAC.1